MRAIIQNNDKTYKSIADAAKANGVSIAEIYRAVVFGKKINGNAFQYAGEYKPKNPQKALTNRRYRERTVQGEVILGYFGSIDRWQQYLTA